VISSSTLIEKAKTFFKKMVFCLIGKNLKNLITTQRINTLAMISPVTNEEKQKLLEAITLEK
jgi:hypothetical protein